jgi:hypothetical protein
MLDTIKGLFEDHGFGVALFLTILFIILAVAFAIGWYSLAIYVASKIFAFEFKWIYVLGAWMGVKILGGIFKPRTIKIKGED